MVYSLCHSTRLRQSRGPRGQRLEGGVHAPPERVWGLESFPWCFPIQQPSFLVEHVIGRTKLYKYPSPDVAFSSSIFCKFFCILLSAFLSLSLSLSNSRFVSLSSISSVFFYSWLKGNEFLAPLLSFLSSIVVFRRLHLFYSFPLTFVYYRLFLKILDRIPAFSKTVS